MLDKLFNPRAIAVVGASREKGKVGRSIIENLITGGFTGELYPVNSKAAEVLGKKCYPDVASLPSGIDLAVIAIPAKIVPETIEECGRKGIGSVIVISAGFKEVGEGGKDLEKRLYNSAMASGVRVLGPNCLGLISTQNNMNASFAANYPEKGDIAVMSQSGAICTAILDWSINNHIGFSKLSNPSRF